jgi:hypothetical protein
MGAGMGQAVRPSGPSKFAEALVARLVPPACREEVLGDLHERFQSPRQYALDSLRTIPLVILSRIRRAVDPQVLSIQASAWYLSFLGAAWLAGAAIVREPGGLLRLALPAALAMLGLTLDDTYAPIGPKSSLRMVRGPLLGFLFAFVSQETFRIGHPDLALPRWIFLDGGPPALLLSSTIRICFPPASSRPQPAGASTRSVARPGESAATPQLDHRLPKGRLIIVTIAVIGAWMASRAGTPKAAAVPIFLAGLVAAYQMWKRD